MTSASFTYVDEGESVSTKEESTSLLEEILEAASPEEDSSMPDLVTLATSTQDIFESVDFESTGTSTASTTTLFDDEPLYVVDPIYQTVSLY
jgi:hypothetical protein